MSRSRSLLIGLAVVLGACSSSPDSKPSTTTVRPAATTSTATAAPSSTSATSATASSASSVADEPIAVTTTSPVPDSTSTMSTTSATQPTRTYVLVHGAFSAGFAWQHVAPLLEANGDEVITVDLPAHGDDTTSPATVTLEGYRDAVVAAIGDRRDVYLVGHSFGGMVISMVAEQIPDQIHELVYLAALLPQDGESALALTAGDTASGTNASLILDPAVPDVATIKPESVIDLFCADCSESDQAFLLSHPQPEPIGPIATPVVLTDANFGSVAKYYITTTDDRAVTPDFQRFMMGRTTLAGTAELRTSHSPFFSAPEELVATLESL